MLPDIKNDFVIKTKVFLDGKPVNAGDDNGNNGYLLFSKNGTSSKETAFAERVPFILMCSALYSKDVSYQPKNSAMIGFASAQYVKEVRNRDVSLKFTDGPNYEYIRVDVTRHDRTEAERHPSFIDYSNGEKINIS